MTEIAPKIAPKIAVVIASKGRPEELGLWTGHMRRQSHQPDLLLWAVTGPADLPDRSDEEGEDGPLVCISKPGLYGCNMVFRRAAIQGVWFDENLPLYGWQEDVDFARRIEHHGILRGTNAFVGVHLGSRRGRVNECRLGYSQVSNMIYLIRKGSMPAHYGLKRMAFNMLANHARAFFAEPWIDRAGRAKGNWMALGDLMRGRITPQRVLEL